MPSRSGPTLIPAHVLSQRPPLARELIQRRILRGETQAQVAAHVGIHTVTYQSIESGRLIPSAPTLARIKAALGWT